jgi:hypothetical protein
MKTRTLVTVIIFAAAILTIAPWAIIMGGDEFTLTGPEGHKVFAYGFPFRVAESPGLPIHTEGWQVPLRFLGNFTVFVIAGFFITWAVRRLCAGTHESAA